MYIGANTVILWLLLFFLTLADFYNEYFDWWYVAIMMAFYIPLLVSSVLFLSWMSSSIKS